MIFAVDDDMIVGAVTRPKAWPSFKTMRADILFGLRKIEWWRIFKEVKSRNKGAFLIAQSVTRDLRLQSYVAAGYPFWLQGIFERVSLKVKNVWQMFGLSLTCSCLLNEFFGILRVLVC